MAFQLFLDEPALVEIDELLDIDNIPYISQVREKLPSLLEEGDYVTLVFALHVELEDEDEDDDMMEVQKMYQTEITKIDKTNKRQFVGKLIKIVEDNGNKTEKFYKPGELISFGSEHIYQIPFKEHFKVLKKKSDK
jgi:hypothetical protein